MRVLLWAMFFFFRYAIAYQRHSRRCDWRIFVSIHLIISHTGWRRAKKENSSIDANNSSNHCYCESETHKSPPVIFKCEKVFRIFREVIFFFFVLFVCCVRAHATKQMFVYFVVANFYLAQAIFCAVLVLFDLVHWSRIAFCTIFAFNSIPINYFECRDSFQF